MGSGRLDSSTLCMQAIPECRKRVWKKEWQRIVGSQTSFLTGTKRTANRHKQWRDGKRRKGEINIAKERWQDGQRDGGKDEKVRSRDVKVQESRKKGQRKEIKEKFMDDAILAMDMTVRVKNDFVLS